MAEPQDNDRAPRSDGPLSHDVDSLARVRIWQIQAFRDLLFVGAVLGIVWVGYALRAVTVPLLVALLLAYLFEPIVVRFSKRPGWSRSRVVGGLLALMVGAVVVVVAFLAPLVVGQTSEMVRAVRDGTLRSSIAQVERFVPELQREDFRSFLDLLPGVSGTEVLETEADADGAAADGAAQGDPEPDPALDALVREAVRDELARLGVQADDPAEEQAGMDTGRWMNWARGGANAVIGVIGLAIQMGMLAFLIPFYFYFFSIWYPDVQRFGREMLPRKNRERTLELLSKMDAVVSGFVRGRIVISFLMGLCLWIGWMVCGVPYALLLGLVVGVFSAVPYLGGIGIPLAVGLNLFSRMGEPGNEGLWWLWVVLGPVLVFALVQVLEGYVFIPVIAGKATNLDPVTILVAVLAGGSVLGVYGMLLAIPLAACGRILLTDIVLVQVREWVEGRAKDPLPIDRE